MTASPRHRAPRAILALSLLLTLAASPLAGCSSEPEDKTPQQTTGAPDMQTADQGADMPVAADMGEADAGADMAEADMGPPMLTIPAKPWDITAQGPYNVGYFDEEVTYTTRQGDERTLRLCFWYPTQIVEGAEGRYVKNLLARGAVFKKPPIAPVSETLGESLPLMVFSHGNSGIAEQNYFMTEYFASHGWIVVAPDHAKNTFLDQEGGAINLKSGAVRPQDISAVIDHVLGVPQEHVVAGRVNADEIVLSGHSFGGYTTLATTGAQFQVDEGIAACERGEISDRYCELFEDPDDLAVFREGFLDSRVKVAVPMTPAGAFFFAEGIGAITIPSLMMTGARDESLRNDEEGDPIWAEFVGEQHVRLDLADGGHFTFSNMCNLNGVPLIDYDGCGEEYIDAMIAQQLINHYTMAFARFHLWGDDAQQDLISGKTLPYEGVTVMIKGEQVKRVSDVQE